MYKSLKCKENGQGNKKEHKKNRDGQKKGKREKEMKRKREFRCFVSVCAV